MKRSLFIIAAICCLAGCKDVETPDNFRDALFVDSENTTAEGSYVQGAALNEFAKVSIPYQNAKGGNAKIWAPEHNGIVIAEQTVAMSRGDGVATVNVSGTPIAPDNTFLQINVDYMGQTYISSAEIPVTMDPDPSGVIDFEISDTPVNSLLDLHEIVFTVTPAMASVVVDATAAANLAARVEQDLQAGTGKVILTPGVDFLSGSVTVTATFGVRPVQTVTIDVNAFDGGDGAEATPYLVSTVGQFMKIGAGPDRCFKLTDDLVPGTISPVSAAFSGSLDGSGHTIEYTIDSPAADNMALFATLAQGARVSNLVLKGSVTGRDNVAALAAVNNGATLTDVTAAPETTVTGRNNVALLSASGSGRDARVLSFGNTPASVNITQGMPGVTADMAITPKDAAVTFDAGATNLKSITYDTASGMATFTMPDNTADFNPGEVSFTAGLGASALESNVRSTARMINVSSKKMYESGDGTQATPYIVIDADQFTATLTTYPTAYITLAEDITLASWTTIPSFGGVLDGGGKKAAGLNTAFVTTLTGTIKNIKFADVDITISVAFGTIARTASGSAVIDGVAVTGKINSSNTGDILGGIVGEATNTTSITDCYVNLDITATCGMTGGIVGRLMSGANSLPGVTIRNCTVEGNIMLNASKTRIGGILGRGEGYGTIKNCLCTMTIDVGNTGANGFGGIFGANNNDNLYIEENMFTGSIRSGNDVGGIAGVGPRVRNCIVSGATVANAVAGGNGNVGGICGTGKVYTDKCIVVGSTITGVTGTSIRSAAGIASLYQNSGYTSNCVVISTAISGNDAKRISGPQVGTFALSNNYATADVTLTNGGVAVTPVPDAAGQDGGDAPATLTRAWFEGLGYDFTTVWKWDAVAGVPALQNVGCAATVKP